MVSGVGCQVSGDRGSELESGNLLNSELGMRPPAHRGLCLRPGGNAERLAWGMAQRA